MREEAFEFYTNNNMGILIRADPNVLNRLAIVAACAIMDFCICNKPDHNIKCNQGVLSMLEANASEHYWLNVMMGNVQLVYSYVRAHVENRDRCIYIFPCTKTVKMLTNALDDFQAWKTKYIASEQAEYGPNWGSATGFHKAVWNQYNEAFLKSFEPK